MSLVLVLVGGAIGAPLRYLIDQVVAVRNRTRFPGGTFTVNVVGSFLLGVVTAAVNVWGAPTWVATFVGTGFCGALTTFSTFGVDTVRLLELRAWKIALANVLLSLAAGLLACAGGWELMAHLA